MTRTRSARRTSLVAFVVVLATLFLTSCGFQSAAPGQMGVVVDGYMINPTDPVIKGCIKSETNQNEITNDVYFYPARQISWDATGGNGAERDPYKVVSNREAPAELLVPVTITMDLTTDCELMGDFHRSLGTKYTAWLDENGNTTEGWIALLDFVVGQPTGTTLTRTSQLYTWQAIWNDDAIRVEFEQTLEDVLPAVMKDRTNGKEFFTNIQVTVEQPTPVDPALVAAINKEQASVAEANAAQKAAEAQVTQAQAETRVAQEKALQQQAEIAGYPTVESYLQAQMIEKGLNPLQPTWVVPGAAPQN